MDTLVIDSVDTLEKHPIERQMLLSVTGHYKEKSQ